MLACACACECETEKLCFSYADESRASGFCRAKSNQLTGLTGPGAASPPLTRTAHDSNLVVFARNTLLISRSLPPESVPSLYFFPLRSLLRYLAPVITAVKDGLVRLRRRKGRRVHCRVSIYIFRLPSDKICRIRNLPTRRLSFPQFLCHVGNCRLQRARHGL